jgi:predicted Na+-dependent transporter
MMFIKNLGQANDQFRGSRSRHTFWERTSAPMTVFAKLIHKKFLWLLLASYVLGAAIPALGSFLAEGETLNFGNGPVVPQFLLGFIVLLSTYGYCAKNDNKKTKETGIGLATVFAVRLSIIVVAVPILLLFSQQGQQCSQLAIGLSVVLLMPSAFSSIAWSGKSGANPFIALASVFVTTVVSGATIIIATRMFLGAESTTWIASLLTSDGVERIQSLYLLSVIPALGLGVLTGWLGSKFNFPKVPTRELNALLILALNYMNASVAFGEIFSTPAFLPLPFSVLIGTALCTLGYVLSIFATRNNESSHQARLSTIYSSSMYNTGLAQVVILLLVPGGRWALIPALFMTFIQHIGATVSTNYLVNRPESSC